MRLIPNEPQWYGRLGEEPYRKDPRPSEGQVQAIIAAAKPGKERRWAKWPAAVLFAAACLAMTAWLLSSADRADRVSTSAPSGPYAGISRTDFLATAGDRKINIVEEFKGRNEHWAAEYYVYTLSGDSLRLVLCLTKYIGDGPSPRGEMSFTLMSGDTVFGSVGVTYVTAPEQNIYSPALTMPKGAISDPASLKSLKMLIKSSGDEQFEWVTLYPSEG